MLQRFAFVMLSIVSGLSLLHADDKPIPIWPKGVPDAEANPKPERILDDQPGRNKVIRITDVSVPTLTIHRPKADIDTGASVVIAPGGGYNILAWDLEGEEVATWLNSIGVTGIVLKYRVPGQRDEQGNPPTAAVRDAQRAVRFVRSHAKAWNLDPNRIGMLGFSAGGNLTAWTGTHFNQESYDKQDDIDELSSRPDFLVLVYPAYLTTKEKPNELAAGLTVTKETPPTLLVHAYNDPYSPENSIALYLALKKQNVPAEMHLYATGGHGFGLRPSDKAVSTWPQRGEAWLREMGMLKTK